MEKAFTPQHTELFTSLGLTADAAKIYEFLLTNPATTARKIALGSSVPRTLAYAVLERLEKELLVTRDDTSKVATYAAMHPDSLTQKADEKKRGAEHTALLLQQSAPTLASLYNLGTGRPNVQFFEGLDGLKRCLEDSLTAQSEILCFLDIESVWEYIPDLNRDYAKRRLALGIMKRNISADTQQNRFYTEGYYPTITKERLVPMEEARTKTVVHMYDNKVSYFTLGVSPMISVIISDPHIYEMNKSLFESLWRHPQAYIPEHQREDVVSQTTTHIARA